MNLKGLFSLNKSLYALTHSKKLIKIRTLFADEMEGTHNYAMNLIVPLMGIAPLLMLFILKGERKSKSAKSWTRSIN